MLKNIAFYAPMKSPFHPVPSGDRTMGRAIMAALSELDQDTQVTLVSELSCRDSKGNAGVQQTIQTQATREVDRLLAEGHAGEWQAWVTYHNYYKAPDLVGPVVSKALGIPYVLVEASRANKRLTGPWAKFALAAERACDAADSIFYMTERDHFALKRAQPDGQQLVHLRPFLNQTKLPEQEVVSDKKANMLAVGMLRYGDKLASYENLADALQHVTTPDWLLSIVGSGEAEDEIKALFAPFAQKVTFLGKLEPEQVADQMSAHHLFVWPGVNEAFGMVYLEAQSFGNWVIAENRDGVRDVIGPTGNLVAENDPVAFAQAIDDVFAKSSNWAIESAVARDYLKDNHLRQTATQTFRSELTRLIGRAA